MIKDENGFDGVWRTIRGRRVFIRKGESLDSAMERAISNKRDNIKSIKEEKKNTKEENIKSKNKDNIEENIEELEKKVRDNQNRINEIEDSAEYLFGDEKLNKEDDRLLEERTILQKQLLDEKAKIDKTMIQDKELRDYIYDYTNGKYRTAVHYTQYLADGLNENESFKKANYYDNAGIDKLSDKEFKNEINVIKKLSNEIDKQKENDNTLIRFEKTQEDEYGRDMSYKYKEGEIVKWGIRSTSSNENYFDKIMAGEDKIKAGSLSSSYPHTYTEYRIVGKKKGLDISKYSQYKDQDEVLVKGNFVVKKVENYEPKIVYDEKPLTFKDYLKNNEYTYKTRLTKKGKEFIEIYDKNGQVVYERPTDYFTQSIDNYYSYNHPTFEDVVSGEVPYKIEKIENKKKSTYGTKRQIVTLQQIR